MQNTKEPLQIYHPTNEYDTIEQKTDLELLKILPVDVIGEKEKLESANKRDKILIGLLVINILFLFLTSSTATQSIMDYLSDHTSSQDNEEEQMDIAADTATIFYETGFLFPDSDSRYLTEEEVYELQNAGLEDYDFKSLLGFARNEIYARRGYPFKQGGVYDVFYNGYDWYNSIEHTVFGDEVFNEYERANRDLIVSIEKREGYR